MLFGGDYMNMQCVGGGRVPPRAIAAILARITALHGRIAILGNHDYIYGDDDVAAALRANGITVLDHSAHGDVRGTRHRRDRRARRPYRAGEAQELLAGLRRTDRPSCWPTTQCGLRTCRPARI